MKQDCLSCKWVYVGKYSDVYKGRPIGCVRPDDGSKGSKSGCISCYEPREENKDVLCDTAG